MCKIIDRISGLTYELSSEVDNESTNAYSFKEYEEGQDPARFVDAMDRMSAAEVESAFKRFKNSFKLKVWDYMAYQGKATIEAFEVHFDTVNGTKLADYDKNAVKSAIEMGIASLVAMRPAPTEIEVKGNSITALWVFPNRIPISNPNAYTWLQEFILYYFLPTNSVCSPIYDWEADDIGLYQSFEKTSDYNIFLSQFNEFCRIKSKCPKLP